MDDFEIDVEEQEEEKPKEEAADVQLPQNYLLFGELGQDDVRVYIREDVYKALEAYSSEDMEHERGTILIGDHSEELGKTHVIISGYIEAKYTDASASTLTFTHKTWEYVHKEREEKYPDKKIVGWQHTHPSYGIFLSNYDLFIQENFFDLPFQTAYVIDPVQNLRGFFQWKNGRIEKLNGYYVYGDVGKTIKIGDEAKGKEKKKSEGKNVSALVPLLIVLILALLGSVVFSAFLFNRYNVLTGKYNEQVAEQERIGELLSDQKEQTEKLRAEISERDKAAADLEELLIDSVIDAANGKTVGKLIEKIEKNEITLNDSEKVRERLLEVQKSAGAPEPDDEGENVVRLISHEVTAGETLTSICAQYGIDYGAYKNMILAVNGITDADLILAGQTVLIPVTDK